MVRIGIIGCGKIAQVRHIPEYEANSHAALVGFFDLNLERAAELAAAHGGRAYSSYEELLADESIDAVSVCTTNATHAEITIAALRAGKDVLCEKPMAITLADAEEMVRVSEETGRQLMIGQNQRLTGAHQEAKRLLDAGTIGDLLTFRTTFGHGGPETWSIDPGKDTWFFDKTKAAMGAMADLGVHKTDLIHYLSGQRVVRTQALLTTLDKRDATGNLIGVDDNAICIYQLSGGGIGTMTASWTYYGPEDNSTVLYGTRGIMRIYDDPRYAIKVYAPDGTETAYEVGAMQTNDAQTSSGVIDAFIGHLVAGTSPEISGAAVLGAMRAVFASIESSRTGVAVDIPANRN